MFKWLVAIAGLVLAAALAVPVYGATLKVSGKYVETLMYDGEATLPADSVTSVNPGGIARGINLSGMSTLCLALDFVEEDLFEAYLPLALFRNMERDSLAITLDPDDEYSLVYRGDPFTLSLTSATEGDYAFSDLKDPLGLVREIDTDDMVVMKLTGKPWGTNLLGYLANAVFTDKKGNTWKSRYGALRTTYELPGNSWLGLTYGACQTPNSPGGANDSASKGNISIAKNISIDMSVPIPLSKKATLQGALAISKGTGDCLSYASQNALSLKIRKLELGNITFAGDLIAVEPGFVSVAHKEDSSDAFEYKGKRYLRGEGKTTFRLFDRSVKTTLSYEHTTNHDGSFDLEKGSSKSKVSGEVEFRLDPDVTVTVDAYLDRTLADLGDYKDDYTRRVKAKVSYELSKGNEIQGQLWHVEKEHKNSQGTAHKLEAGVKIKSSQYGKVEGNAGYEQGTVTFPSYTSVGKHTTKLYGEIYGELARTFMPDQVEQVNVFLAGLAKYAQRMRRDAQVALVAYGEVDVALSEQFNNKTVLLFAKESKKTSHYGTTVYNKFDYKISDNACLTLEYIFKRNRATLYALYTVMIGDIELELGYGKTGLRDECTATNHEGKPWAWLCSAEIEPKPKLFTLKITVPF